MRAKLIFLVGVACAACASRPPATAPAVELPNRPGGLPAAISTVGAVMVDPPDRVPISKRSLAAIGLDPDALDRTVDPCDDFYQFACGGWVKRTEIAADKSIAMRSFVDIEDRNLEYERAVLEAARQRPGDDPIAKQLGAFYGSCMDAAAIERTGLAPLRPLLATIDRIRDPRTLTAALAAIDAAGLPGLFTLSPVADAADANQVIAGLDQGGLGLPDRDYYLSDDDDARAALATYQTYVESVLTAIGHRTAHHEAADVLGLETAIARIWKDKAARRDPAGNYHPVDRAGMARAMPRFDWRAYWAAIGVGDTARITVSSLDLLTGLDALIGSIRPETWRAYLAFRVADELAPVLTEQLEDIQFQFSSAMTGQPEQSPRWKRCVGHTVDALGDLVGQLFVRDRFGGAPARLAAEDYVRSIVGAMADNLGGLAWMDDVTRAAARAKLDALTYQVGYPDRWRSYNFKLDPRAWAANAMAARKAERARQIAKIGKPVDRRDWKMSAAQVNAYFDPPLNAMVFPAGVLQPPLFSPRASPAVNFGGIGAVIGHELTHAFDDQGARYDASGNLARWWQPETEREFGRRTQCLIDQYGSYEVSGGTRINGANTVGENIADIGGVKLSFAAYRRVRAAASERLVAEGFNEDQQFFLGFGQAWCAKLRPDLERMLAVTDVHAPARWRVNGALSATPEFARTFRCKAGARMAPAKQCVVW